MAVSHLFTAMPEDAVIRGLIYVAVLRVNSLCLCI